MKVNHRTLFRLYTYQWYPFRIHSNAWFFLNQPITCVLHTELWPGMGLEEMDAIYRLVGFDRDTERFPGGKRRRWKDTDGTIYEWDYVSRSNMRSRRSTSERLASGKPGSASSSGGRTGNLSAAFPLPPARLLSTISLNSRLQPIYRRSSSFHRTVVNPDLWLTAPTHRHHLVNRPSA
jgi:hypothetical protein